ncbi:unnamed protein product [marine sediment metagenome]|uniref:Small multi-drug export protein n=1 Tax=marine sediment metagenome TaxID=412755 RepID=X0RTB5_9ZZZZ
MYEDLVNLGVSKPLVEFIISMLPVVELRGALPVAINVYNIQWYFALPIAFIGNLIPIPFLFFFLERLRRLSARMGIIGVWVEKFLNHTRQRAELIEKYGRLGLVLFVAIPLPVTGAWTGSIAAYLLGMKFRDALLPICLGVLISGIVVTVLCLLGWVGAIIAGIGFGALVLLWLWPRRGESKT